MSTQIIPDFNKDGLLYEHNRFKYLSNTNKLNSYNEIYGMNKYANDLNIKKNEDLRIYRDQLKNQLYLLKQQYFITEYKNHNISFWINIVYFTLVTISIAIIFIAIFNHHYKNKANILYVGLFVLSLIYLIIFMMALGKKLTRRRYAWNQYYWPKYKS